jgi:hypothetical protein
MEQIFAREAERMEFETWIRVIDNYSQLYTQYLNPQGVITKHCNLVRNMES